jgi:hypothetical protein
VGREGDFRTSQSSKTKISKLGTRPQGGSPQDNIEPQNKEPQKYVMITSTFDIHYSIFCGSLKVLIKKAHAAVA